LIAGASIGFAMIATGVVADDYPAKTIKVVTHAGNSGVTNIITLIMMFRARRKLKQDMVAVNKKVGGGAVAMNYYLGAPADVHTIIS